MKLFIITFSFLWLTSLGFAQNYFSYEDYYGGAGYSIGVGNFSNANDMLHRFNAATTQEKEFKNFSVPNGFTCFLGTTQSLLNLELGFTQVQQKRTSKYLKNESLYLREVRLRVNSYSAGAGIYSPVTRSFGMGANAHISYNITQLSSRERQDKAKKISYLTPSKNNTYGLILDMKFVFGSQDDIGNRFIIRPYYTVLFDDLDGSDLDDSINGAGTSSNYNSLVNLNHFGIKLAVSYAIVP